MSSQDVARQDPLRVTGIRVLPIACGIHLAPQRLDLPAGLSILNPEDGPPAVTSRFTLGWEKSHDWYFFLGGKVKMRADGMDIRMEEGDLATLNFKMETEGVEEFLQFAQRLDTLNVGDDLINRIVRPLGLAADMQKMGEELQQVGAFLQKYGKHLFRIGGFLDGFFKPSGRRNREPAVGAIRREFWEEIWLELPADPKEKRRPTPEDPMPEIPRLIGRLSIDEISVRAYHSIIISGRSRPREGYPDGIPTIWPILPGTVTLPRRCVKKINAAIDNGDTRLCRPSWEEIKNGRTKTGRRISPDVRKILERRLVPTNRTSPKRPRTTPPT